MTYFDRKTVVINLLKNDPSKGYTSYQIATWILKNYPEEMERKMQTSNDKRLLKARSKVQEIKIITKIYAHEFDKEFRTAIQTIEPKIKIIKKGNQFRYYYVNSTDRIVNYDNIYFKPFDRNTAVVELLRTHPGRNFTNFQIATWLVNNYPKEMERKMQASNDKRLLNIVNEAERKEIFITTYVHELNKQFRIDIQRIEPKIRVIKKGFRFTYCYINNADKVVNYEFTMHKEFELKSVVINFLKDHLGKEYTSSQITTWIFDNYPAEMERKIEESNDKRLLKARSKTLKRKITIMIYRNEFNKEFRAAIQKMEPKIKIIKKGTLFKYCYINSVDRIVNYDNKYCRQFDHNTIDKIVNYEFTIPEEFDLKSEIIKLLKTNPGQEFSGPQIAKWVVTAYPKQAEQKEQTSNDKRLLSAKSKAQKTKIIIMIYRNELNKQLRAALQMMEPKIKIIKKGTLFKYCYINNADKIVSYNDGYYEKFDCITAVIKFLKTSPGKEFTSYQIAKWIIKNYPKEAEQKLQTSNNKLLFRNKKEIVILLYRNEIDKTLCTTIKKIEPKIKIIRKGRWLKYCYVDNTDKIVNYNDVYYKEFDRKTAVIEFLKAHPGKEFTSIEIATWIVDVYHKEAEQKLQTSNDKRLLGVTDKVERKKIIIRIYGHDLNKLLNSSIQKLEPKIKVIRKGRPLKYCYVDNTDKIFDKFKIIKTLENYEQQEFTAHEMAQLLLGTNSR